MPFQYIGSTRALSPGQCQNDIWTTEGDPNSPVLGDCRIIVQAINVYIGVICCEAWLPSANAWVVIPMLPNIRMIDTDMDAVTPMEPQMLNTDHLTNQSLLAPFVTGYAFVRSHTIYLDTDNGKQLFYIRHQDRQGDNMYLDPAPGDPQRRAMNQVQLWEQASIYREVSF